jgi:hypothetical protein
MNTRANEQIEQFIALGLVLIQASVDYAGGVPQDRPDEEVSADIRRLRTVTAALGSALDQAERRPAVVTPPVGQNYPPALQTS